MVFIHGGAFINGSGSMVDLSPDNLLDENVIVVTFNYRLNVIGKYNNDVQFALLMYEQSIHMCVNQWRTQGVVFSNVCIYIKYIKDVLSNPPQKYFPTFTPAP